MDALACTECERRAEQFERGWQGQLVDLDDDGQDEVAFYCPSCAAREFGPGTSSSKRGEYR